MFGAVPHQKRGGPGVLGVLTDRTGTGLRPAALAERDEPRYQGEGSGVCRVAQAPTPPPWSKGGVRVDSGDREGGARPASAS